MDKDIMIKFCKWIRIYDRYSFFEFFWVLVVCDLNLEIFGGRKEGAHREREREYSTYTVKVNHPLHLVLVRE